ncbi:MAG: polysaccharide deacetylase family protein [bacterium]|nr:polysaccharide deacetylase family protein [bacterium]
MQPLPRRQFLQSLALGYMGMHLRPVASAQPANRPYYIAAYDTESPTCLKALPQIVARHKDHAMPATFFIVGARLEENAKEYKALLDDPLFEIASHSYSHKMLRNHPICGNAAGIEQIREEILRGKAVIESVFERPCLGFRPACGFDNGFKKAPEVLAIFEEAKIAYISSWLWGPDYSLPILFENPFTYAEENHPDLWELPAQGWHENLLKNNNKMGPRRLTLWPSAMPEAVPAGYIQTPEEEFGINKIFLDKAIHDPRPYVSLVWHPWSLFAFDPEMKMLDLTFTYVKEAALQPCTFLDLYHALQGEN